MNHRHSSLNNGVPKRLVAVNLLAWSMAVDHKNRVAFMGSSVSKSVYILGYADQRSQTRAPANAPVALAAIGSIKINTGFEWPCGIAVDSLRNRLYVADRATGLLHLFNYKIHKISKTVAPEVEPQPTKRTKISSHKYNTRLASKARAEEEAEEESKKRKLNVGEKHRQELGFGVQVVHTGIITGFNRPHNCTVNDSTGDLYITDEFNDRVVIFTATSLLGVHNSTDLNNVPSVRIIGTGVHPVPVLAPIRPIPIDPAAATREKTLAALDNAQMAIDRAALQLARMRHIIDNPLPKLTNPRGIAVDSVTGEIFISEAGKNEIGIWNLAGHKIRTINCELNGPIGLTLIRPRSHVNPVLLVADQKNNRAVGIDTFTSEIIMTIKGVESDQRPNPFGFIYLPISVAAIQMNNTHEQEYAIIVANGGDDRRVQLFM